MSGKIPATVVTGFLGAGKTTLIRHILARAEGRRIALVVNEFGDLGVDGEILKGCGDATCTDDDVIELSNGCICCTVAEDFVPTIEKLIGRAEPPDHIVIETSGLALPQPLVRAFGWPAIRNRVTVDGVVTVVDGPAVAAGRFAHDEAAVDRQRAADEGLDHDTPLAELFEDQLACADLVVVSKTDLMPGGSNVLEAGLAERVRPGVRVVAAVRGEVDPRVALGLGIGAEDDLEARAELHHHHHHDDDDHHEDDHHHHDDHGHDAFATCVIPAPAFASREAALDRIGAAVLASGVLRLKGFVAIEGKPMRLVVQAVGPRVDAHFDRPFRADEARASKLVAIGFRGFDAEALTRAIGR